MPRATQRGSAVRLLPSASALVKLALRIEVATLRGTREAVPRLVSLLEEYGAGATFLFTLGRDRTGRALAQLPRVPRWRCYGARALLSGTLLPGADIGARCAAQIRAVRDAGFEAGVQAYDRAGWLRRAEGASEAWTRAQIERARERLETILGEPPLTHGAAGWRMNRHAWRLTQQLGFRHGSDTRGRCPFIPILDGEIIACPQLPTTLPTLEEVAPPALGPEEAARRLLERSREPALAGHVCTLRAEVEGTLFLGALRALLAGWRALGYQIVSLRDYASDLDLARLPRHLVRAQPGAGGPQWVQGTEFLA